MNTEQIKKETEAALAQTAEKMRDIRFRAWDKEERIWLDPEHFYITGEGRAFTCQQGRHNISCRYQLMGTERYVIEQFTGLKDKNGKEEKECFG